MRDAGPRGPGARECDQAGSSILHETYTDTPFARKTYPRQAAFGAETASDPPQPELAPSDCGRALPFCSDGRHHGSRDRRGNKRTGRSGKSQSRQSAYILNAEKQKLPVLANALIMLRSDPALQGIVALDEMLRAPILMHELEGGEGFRPRPVNDTDVSKIQAYMQHAGLAHLKGYGPPGRRPSCRRLPLSPRP
jgi:hypothetical protein